MTGPISTSSAASAASAATGANAAAVSQQRAELRAAAQQFEAIFLRQMIGSMREAKLADDVFGSSATQQFTEMSDARLADDMAKRSNFGIADMLMKQFERTVDGQ